MRRRTSSRRSSGFALGAFVMLDLLPLNLVFPNDSAGRDKAQPIFDALHVLSQALTRFKATLALYDHVKSLIANLDKPINYVLEEEVLYSQWKGIAGDQGAITIWDFEKGLEAFQRATSLEAFRSVVRHDRRQAARTQFDASFPNFRALRYSAAHSAERSLYADKHGATGDVEGVIVEPGVTGMLISGFKGDKVFTTVDKRAVSYELSQQTLDRLWLIARMAASAISKDD
jgi:hypothetical protein